MGILEQLDAGLSPEVGLEIAEALRGIPEDCVFGLRGILAMGALRRLGGSGSMGDTDLQTAGVRLSLEFNEPLQVMQEPVSKPLFGRTVDQRNLAVIISFR